MKRSSLELGEERKGADESLKKLERRDIDPHSEVNMILFVPIQHYEEHLIITLLDEKPLQLVAEIR